MIKKFSKCIENYTNFKNNNKKEYKNIVNKIAIGIVILVVLAISTPSVVNYYCRKNYKVGTVNFKDKNLEELVRNATGKTMGYIYTKDVEKIKILDGRSLNISDLSGIEDLKNIETLSLKNNDIEDISPIGKLTNLKALNIGINKINDISPLKNLTKLEELNISSNNIYDLTPIKGKTKMKKLDISYNKWYV